MQRDHIITSSTTIFRDTTSGGRRLDRVLGNADVIRTPYKTSVRLRSHLYDGLSASDLGGTWFANVPAAPFHRTRYLISLASNVRFCGASTKGVCTHLRIGRNAIRGGCITVSGHETVRTVTAKTSPGVDPDYPLSPVPIEARRSLLSMVAVLLGFTFFSPTMLAGAQLGAAFTVTGFLAVLAVGSLVLGLYVSAMGAIGARTGLTTVLLARYTLGIGGAKWADLLLGGTQVGWYGVIVAALAELIAAALDLQSYSWLLAIVGGVLMAITAYYGYRSMAVLSLLSVPLLLILAFWVLGRAFEEVGGWAGLLARQPVESMSWAAAITIIAGTFISGGTQVPNWTRFARNWQEAFLAGFIAFFFGNGLMLLFGGMGAVAFGEGDFVKVLYNMGLITWGVIFLILNLWTTSQDTAYAFGVAGAEFFNCNDRRPFVVAGAGIGILLAITGIYNVLIDWLILLGTFIPPLGGTILGDYLFLWRGALPSMPRVRFRTFRWSTIVAYLLGTAAAFIGTYAEIGIPPVNGIAVAALAVPACEWLFRSLGVPQEHVIG